MSKVLKEKIRVSYAGNPEFAIPPLETIIKDDRFQVVSIICAEKKKAGRKQTLQDPPLVSYVKQHYPNKIFIHQQQKIKEIEHQIQAENLDFLIVFAYGQLIPKSILDIPRFGCINIHPSLLPRYRGATPVQEALLHGDKETGVTFFLMDEKLDSGDILRNIRKKIHEEDTAETLLHDLSLLAAKELPSVLIDFSKGKVKPAPQDHSKASFCRKISKEDGKLDFQKETANVIVRKIRAYQPWPGCFFFHRGKRIKILAATEDSSSIEQKISSGSFLITSGGRRLKIGTKDGVLVPLLLQLEGKKILPVEEFLRGNVRLFQDEVPVIPSSPKDNKA